MISLLLFCLWFGQSQERAAESQSPTNDQQQATPSVLSPAPSQDAGQSRNERQQHQGDSASWSDPLIFLQLLLFIAVAIQAGVYVWQAVLMRRTLAVLGRQEKTAGQQFEIMALSLEAQMTMQRLEMPHMLLQALTQEDQLKAMRGQLEVMRQQAIEAGKQAALASRQIELMVLSECAYIAVEGLSLRPEIRNHELIIDGQFFNGGRTPAWDFKRQLGVDVVPKPPPIGWTFDWEGKPCDESDGVLILAGRPINFSTNPRKVTDAEIAGLNGDELVILVVGKCEYLDSTGGKQIYTFGVTFDLGGAGRPPRCLIHYQNHRREKTEAENPNQDTPENGQTKL